MRAVVEARAARTSGRLPGWVYQPTTAWSVALGEEVIEAELEGAEVTVGGMTRTVELDWRPGQRRVRTRVDGQPFLLQADPRPEGWRLTHGGAEVTTIVRTRRAAEYVARMPKKVAPDSSKLVRSPMPGLIVRVDVKPGQEVKAGQELCILEAMKMENVLRATHDGTIGEVKAAARDTVAADQILLTFV
jgi:propionyl-CoA carboxylase alpha chain